jgi:hypothetical protein
LRSLLVLVVLALLLALFLLLVPLNRKLQFSRIWTGALQTTGEAGLLVFPGELNAEALGLTQNERDKVRKFLQENSPGVKRVEVWASQQDAYAALQPDSQLSMNVVVFMEDGTVLKPPTTPLTRKELADKLIVRLRRDLDAYNKAAVKGGVGKDVIITNVL